MEPVLFVNDQQDRPATLEEYRASGGYEALTKVVKESIPPDRVVQRVSDSGLRGRGGAGFPAGKKWQSVPADGPQPRYVVANTDELEPGTFKDRVLVGIDPHVVIEGMILAAYAIQAPRGIMFIRPSYELDAEMVERELARARTEGFLGSHILGSGFSFDVQVHRSAGRYICGEANAQLNAILGRRPHPLKRDVFPTVSGLWGKPTLVNNVETLACVPHILRRGPEWFRSLAATESGAGPKLYAVSGKVAKPGCYELPIGTPLREIIEEHAGGMRNGAPFKACLPGGASTRYLTPEFFDVAMDFEPLAKVGHRLGTAAIIVFDEQTCLVGATLNLIQFFARESCGWCTPCREGIPFIRDLLWRIEHGEGREEHVGMLKTMADQMPLSYCAFAPGAASPVESLLTYFEDEVREHISQKKCPFESEYLHAR
ncbi:MAG: SLBB domain-containing protein [Proteobacteria bacterium]|nr:SLBB domain-containing protein [Pseudomonadota bacterium]